MSKTILVTGTAGFIAYRFAEEALKKGHQVIAVDRLSHFEERREHKVLLFKEMIDRENLFSWISSKKPKIDAVVHLGACTDTTQLDEAYLKKMNLEYSQKIWNYCSENKIPLIYASSAATYGGGENGYDDDESQFLKLKALNPYGESKRLFDIWALDQERLGNHPPTWSGFKFFNVYGFGERHKNKMASVVLHAFDQIKKDGQVKLFKSHKEGIEDGHQKRDFVYVCDVVKVLEFALEKPIKRGVFNLGSGRARTYLDLVRAVFSTLEKPEAIEFIDTPVEIRERYQYFTEAKMKRLVDEGYPHPFTSLEDGVREYVSELDKTR